MFKIDEEMIGFLELQKKYVKYFKDFHEDKNYILIKKTFPISELSNEELRILLISMFSVKE